jgi:hypothetical protein
VRDEPKRSLTILAQMRRSWKQRWIVIVWNPPTIKYFDKEDGNLKGEVRWR